MDRAPPRNPAAASHMLFRDFEAYAEAARGWDLETQLLERGGFQADLFYYVAAGQAFQLARSRYYSRVHQTGAAPRGCITFGITCHAEGAVQWRGMTLHMDQLMVFPDQGELDVVTPTAHDVILLSLPADLVHQTAHHLQAPHILPSLSTANAYTCTPQQARSIRFFMHRLEAVLLQSPALPLSMKLHVDLAEYLVGFLSETTPPPRHREITFRERSARQAVSLIMQNCQDITTVSDLCRLTRTSERTLQKGFKTLYGISPKQYLQAWRLNRVRQALHQEGPEAVIADTANQWGFWHMGQFAADYRKLFGELPSQTAGKTAREKR